MALFEEIVRDLIDDTYDIFRRLYSMGMEIHSEDPDEPTRRWIQVICRQMQMTLNRQIIDCLNALSSSSNIPALNIELRKYHRELTEFLNDLRMLTLYVIIYQEKCI